MGPYIMLIWLSGVAGYQYLGPYNSQTACWKESVMVDALDPEVERTQCIPYNDPPPANIG